LVATEKKKTWKKKMKKKKKLAWKSRESSEGWTTSSWKRDE
jgi:hypothetical protein